MMADFCQECCQANFGFDSGDLANLLDPSDYSETHGALALCECCGPVVVDIKGKRVSKDWAPTCNCADILKQGYKVIEDGTA